MELENSISNCAVSSSMGEGNSAESFCPLDDRPFVLGTIIGGANPDSGTDRQAVGIAGELPEDFLKDNAFAIQVSAIRCPRIAREKLSCYKVK